MLSDRRIGPLEQSFRQLLDLCAVIEDIADSLPHPDSRLCIAVANEIEPLVLRMHALQNEVLFPLLAAFHWPELARTVARLRLEQIVDIAAAGEVADALRGLATGGSVLSADAVGYLLRSFFDSMSRHVHGAQELIQLFLHVPSHGPAN